MKKGFINFGFFIFLVCAIYLINEALNFFILPEMVLIAEPIIYLLSGILLVFSGFGFLKKYKHSIQFQ
ncbi:hypothetical protein HOD88_02210 [archaeon]|jgi:hypothetical protein|nr:hypothetical protein [archaeon]